MSGRKLDIGIASWNSPDKLDQTIAAIRAKSATDWRLFIIDNASTDPQTRVVIEKHAAEDKRIVPVFKSTNTGYSGAINTLFAMASTEYIAYIDNDAVVNSHAWDETLAGYLDRYHEIGMIFPNGGVAPIQRAGYTEILWGVGFAWLLNRMALRAIGQLHIGMYGAIDTVGNVTYHQRYPLTFPEDKIFGAFDTDLGHQDEVDYQIRLRLAGYKSAAAAQVSVTHHATSTNNPTQQERINRGVINWVNKWEKAFTGNSNGYFSENVLRFELWPTTQIYMEEWFKQQIPGLNNSPEVINLGGREYDLIKVPRFKDFYRGRII